MTSPTDASLQPEHTAEETAQNESPRGEDDRDGAQDSDLVEPEPELEPEPGVEQEIEPEQEPEGEHIFDDDIEMQDTTKEDDGADKLPSPNELSDEEVDPSQALPADDLEGETMFSGIYNAPASVPGMVSEWMVHVQTNGPTAVASILSMVVNIARAAETPPPDIIGQEAIIANDPATTIVEVRGVIASDNQGKVIVTAKDPSSRRIRRAYEDFWRRIAAEASDVVLYDTDCFDTLITWLDAMATSPSRSLRLAACLAAYRIVDGFVELGGKLRKQLASMQRQLNTEKRRCGVDDKRRKHGKKLSQKGNELAKKVDALTANNSELIELSDKVFRTLFIVKYRDVSPDIRNASVAALGGWILSFPDHFLDDSNNKYIGWLLSDKDPVVRRSSIDALLRMLKKKDFFASLELFLTRFSSRIVEMTRDKDDHVSVGAITLLTNLIEHGVLEREACEQVCETAIEEPHTEIRRAAGEFMSRLIFTHYGNDNEKSPPKRGRSKKISDGIFNPALGEIPSVEQSREYIKELLFAVLRKSDEPSTPFLAVDSVWDSFPAVRCWQAFSDLLLKESQAAPKKGKGKSSRRSKNAATEDEDGLNDFDKSILCEMLLASATESSGNGDPVRAKLVERGERLHPEPPAVLMSQHFLPLLPKLLSHFQTDLRALCALVKLPMHFSPKVFDQDGQDTHFSALLTKIIDVLTRNTGSPEMSSACAETLRSLLSDHNPLKQHAIIALQARCTEAGKDLILQVRSDLSDAHPDGVASAILRVRILSELVDPGSSIEESVLKLFEYQIEHAETSDLGDDVTADAARTASALTIWSLARVRSRLDTFREHEAGMDSVLDLDEVKDLRRLGSSVVDLLHRAFASTALPIAARVKFLQAFLTMCTLARGIEKLALSNASDKQSSDDTQASPSGYFDLLSIQESVRALVPGLKKCVVHLVEHQLEVKDHSLLSTSAQSNKIYPLPEEDLRNCFASLIQASFQSALSSEISHLPLLGLLLKRNQLDLEPSITDCTAFHLCRKYCQQRQLRESSLINDEVRVLLQTASFDIEGDPRRRLVRELAEALLSSRQHGELKIAASEVLLKSLMDHVVDSPENELALNVEIVSNAGFTLCTHLSQSHATNLLEVSKSLRKNIEDLGGEDGSSGFRSTFDALYRALESVSNGETPDIPRIQAKPVAQRRKKRTKKRRRTATSSMREVQPPTAENQNLRRSSREKKRVNYARMEGLRDDSEDESDEVESSDDDLRHSPQSPERTSPQDAAEMARNLMRYGSSPRAPLRETAELPRRMLNPRKRGRPSGQSKQHQTRSPTKSTGEVPRPGTVAVGPRRSSRARRSSAKVAASQESQETPSSLQLEQDMEEGNRSMEMNGLLEENTDESVHGHGDVSRPRAETKNGNEDLPIVEANAGEKDNDEEDEPNHQAAKGSKVSRAVKDGKGSSESSPEQGEEHNPASSDKDEGAEEADSGVRLPSSLGLDNDSVGTPTTPQRGVKGGKGSQQAPRRSPRMLSSSSTGSSSAKSRSPGRGRVQKSPLRAKPGRSVNYSQANKENVNGSSLKTDGPESKLSKIRRRRRRQW